MDVSEVKKAIEKLEINIKILIGNFEVSTGCKVQNVKMIRSDEIGTYTDLDRIKVKVDFG